MINNKQKCYISYVPHGINSNLFFPIERKDSRVQEMRNRLFNGADPEFVLLYNNRNIRRKMTSDAILAFKLFHEMVPKGKDVRFVLHTQPIDENGTDLPAVIEALCPDLVDNIIIMDDRMSTDAMNILYNSCDVTINIASNEGWGLSSTESMMAGVPLINNVTGGLQDQCRFTDHYGKWIDFDENFASNHGGKYRAHGQWVFPVFPAAINLQGSIPTPYIFDDRCNIRDIAAAINYWYTTDPERRRECGLAGREWAISPEAGFTADIMCKRFSEAVDATLADWVAPSRFNLCDAQEEVMNGKPKHTGISI